MTLAELTQALDKASADHKQARASFDSATSAYEAVRRNSLHGPDYERARTAWALAGHEWMRALVARETARDRAAAERRGTAQTETGALPTRGGR